MAKWNHENANIRHSAGTARINARLDKVTGNGQKEFARLQAAKQKRNSQHHTELNETICKHCGSAEISAEEGKGPHAYKWYCGNCGKYIKFTSNPLSETIMAAAAPVSGNDHTST
jgi:transcription elongation factor Elf1